MKEWRALDYLRDKEIKVNQGEKLITGFASGITEQGLLVVDEGGTKHFISFGDAILK